MIFIRCVIYSGHYQQQSLQAGEHCIGLMLLSQMLQQQLLEGGGTGLEQLIGAQRTSIHHGSDQ